MSTYVTASGELVYHDEAALQKALGYLEKGGWILPIDTTGKTPAITWVNEANNVTHADMPVVDLKLVIPEEYYRNLSRVFDSLMDGAEAGDLYWYSTDGYNHVSHWSVGNDKVSYESAEEFVGLLGETLDDILIEDVMTLDSEEYEEKYPENDWCQDMEDVLAQAMSNIGA
jgi:hypothetical protein